MCLSRKFIFSKLFSENFSKVMCKNTTFNCACLQNHPFHSEQCLFLENAASLYQAYMSQFVDDLPAAASSAPATLPLTPPALIRQSGQFFPNPSVEQRISDLLVRIARLEHQVQIISELVEANSEDEDFVDDDEDLTDSDQDYVDA